MQVTPTEIPDVLLIEPKVFGDERGYFFESFSASRYADAGLTALFVQDNVSRSAKGVLRGLHLQQPRPQGKLASVLEGEVFDVAADVRPGSPTFGKWVGCHLSASNKRQLWMPPGLAHGFCVLSNSAIFQYKSTDYYDPSLELSIAWNDPVLAIEWPIDAPKLSGKDAAAARLSEIPEARLRGEQRGAS
jgi:dTDP-4-dehydrorhamnose 3,5-epimerase